MWLKLKRLTTIIILPLSALVITSCDNELLQAVRNFVDSREAASQSVTVIASDFYDSCVRRSIKEPIVLRSFIRIEPGESRPAPFGLREELLERCDNNPLEIGRQFETANSVLLNYIAALEALASEDVIVFPDTTAQQLTNAIQGLAVLDLEGSIETPKVILERTERQQAVRAGVGIFQFVSRLFFNGFRDQELSEVIAENDQAIQEYSNVLKDIVEKGYVDGYLAQELDTYLRYYSNFTADEIAEILPTVSNPSEPLGRNTLSFSFSSGVDNSLSSEVSSVLERKKLARLYIDFLDEVAQGHCDLAVRVSDGKRQPGECSSISNEQASQSHSTKKNILREEEFRQIALQRLTKIKVITDKMKKQNEKATWVQ